MALGEMKRDDCVTVDRMGLGSGLNMEGKYRISSGSGAVHLTPEQVVEMIGQLPQPLLEKAGYFPPEKTE